MWKQLEKFLSRMNRKYFLAYERRNIHLLESEEHAGWIGSYMSYPRQSQICREENESWYSEFFWWWMMVPRLDQYWGMFAPEPIIPIIGLSLILIWYQKKRWNYWSRCMEKRCILRWCCLIFQNTQTQWYHSVGSLEKIYLRAHGIKTIRATPDIFPRNIGVENINSDDTNPYILDKFTLYSMSEKNLQKIINVQQHKKKQYGNNAV